MVTAAPPPRPEPQFREQGQYAENQRPPESFGVPNVGASIDRRALEPVDLLVDGLQGSGIASAEVAATSAGGDLREQRLVNLHRPVFIAQPEQPPAHGDRRHALRADADGVDADAEGARRLCRRARVDGAAVVLAIGQQHHHP